MKKIISITLFLFIITGSAVAQTPTATSSSNSVSPTLSQEEKEVQDLKEKIATKVAQLRSQNNKAVAGWVLSNENKSVKINTSDDEKYEVRFDDSLTKVYEILGNQRKEIRLEDVKKNDYIVVSGVLNDKIITANTIHIDTYYTVKLARVTEVNKENFYIKVLTSDKDSYTLDIESTTNQLMLNIKTFLPEKIGFSKVKEGDTIHFVAKKTGEEKDPLRLTANKILVVPQEFFMK